MPTFGTVCDGIGCGHLAFVNAGFDCAWSFEIEPFPSAVLAHRFPDVKNYGDMLKCAGMIESGEIEAPDVFIGGTPCQAFSVAGKRKGLEDARGNLSLTFCVIADATDDVRGRDGKPPCAVLWENVPGVLSDKGNAFGCFLGELSGAGCQLDPPGRRWRNAGCVFGPRRTVAWRVLDSQFFGVAQRRRRLFVVASAEDGCRPEEVLFEREGVRRDSPPSREKREEASRGIEIGPSGGRFTDLNPTIEARCKDGPIRNQLAGAVLACHTTGAGFWREGMGTLRAREQDSHENVVVMAHGQANAGIPDICGCLSDGAHNGGGLNGQDAYTGRIIPVCASGDTTHALRGEGFDASEDGTGRGTPCIAFSCKDYGNGAAENLSPTLRAMGGDKPNGGGQMAVAFEPRFVRTSGGQPSIELNPCLRADTNTGDGAPCVAFHHNAQGCRLPTEGGRDTSVSDSLTCSQGAAVASSLQVRRLTPEECEKLQALPPGWTLIPWRGKPPADCPDGPRYKAIGNGQTVTVMEWLARRIKAEMTR